MEKPHHVFGRVRESLQSDLVRVYCDTPDCLRKAGTVVAAKTGEDMKVLRIHMKHSKEVQRESYAVWNQRELSAKVSQMLKKVQHLNIFQTRY